MHRPVLRSEALRAQTSNVDLVSGATDTSYAFAVRGDVDRAVADAVFDWVRWVDAVFSTYDDDSEISRLNRRELRLEDAHPHVRAILDRCEELRVATRGYFDVRAAPA